MTTATARTAQLAEALRCHQAMATWLQPAAPAALGLTADEFAVLSSSRRIVEMATPHVPAALGLAMSWPELAQRMLRPESIERLQRACGVRLAAGVLRLLIDGIEIKALAAMIGRPHWQILVRETRSLPSFEPRERTAIAALAMIDEIGAVAFYFALNRCDAGLARAVATARQEKLQLQAAVAAGSAAEALESAFAEALQEAEDVL